MTTIKNTVKLCLLFYFILLVTNVISQTNDTLSNWDNYNLEWNYALESADVVDNPDTQGINPSVNCFKVVTNSDPYNYIYSDFIEVFSFQDFPIFRLKIKGPSSGGSVLLKFENEDNTSWQEIEKVPIPGVWDDLEFDFSNVTATDYKRLVIFFDFQGNTANEEWFVDDLIRVGEPSQGFSSNLPLVIINTNGQDINNQNKITAQMGIIDNGPGEENHQNDPYNDYDGFIGIEIRGQSSQMFPKKSYAVETRDEAGDNLNVSLLGMPEENDWVLYAPYTDKSMLRNYMTFLLGRNLDRYCTRTAFCEVIINNKYRGVSILLEKIKRDDNRVSIAKLNPEDISGDELTGGYIVKVDKIGNDFIYGQDGWLSVPNPSYPNAMNITFQFVEPDADEMLLVQKNYIQTYIGETEDAITANYYSDPNTGYQKYINVGSFIDQMMLSELSKEVDKYRYSTYFFKEKDSDGGKFFAGPPWDFNLGYSNVNYWSPGNIYTGWIYPFVQPHENSIMFWWKRLMEDPYYQDLFKTRWEELRQNEWSDEVIQDELENTVAYLDDAQERNYERWPILGEYVWPNYNWQNNDYNDEVAFFSNWMFNRMHWIDDHITGNTLYPSAMLSGVFPNITITLDDDYFSRSILKKKYFELNEESNELNIDTVLYVSANEALMKFSEEISPSNEFTVTMKAKIINSFNDLTSSSITAVAEFAKRNEEPVKIYNHLNSLYLDCKQPELLGEQVEIYSVLGQLVGVENIDKTTHNELEISLPKGIYICNYEWNSMRKSQTIRVLN